MTILFIIQEVTKIIFYLSLPVWLFILFFNERNQEKERMNKVDLIADRLLELADDEKPVMLNVSQEKLIEKTADEIERRKGVERWGR